jgi:hypothetical protein
LSHGGLRPRTQGRHSAEAVARPPPHCISPYVLDLLDAVEHVGIEPHLVSVGFVEALDERLLVGCAMKLNLPRRTKRQLATRLRQPLVAAAGLNQIWALDVMAGTLHGGGAGGGLAGTGSPGFHPFKTLFLLRREVSHEANYHFLWTIGGSMGPRSRTRQTPSGTATHSFGGNFSNPGVAAETPRTNQCARSAGSERDEAAYSAVQVLGCCIGVILAHAMFDLPWLQWSLAVRGCALLPNLLAKIAKQRRHMNQHQRYCVALVP